MKRIIQLMEQDELRLEALESARKLKLPQCYLAAGFVRNLVWEHLHQKLVPTPLNDVDVIYFDPKEANPERYKENEAMLSNSMPHLNWQVRNQAKMHERNGDDPYLSSIDVMRFWPEKETAVAIRKVDSRSYGCVSAFGFESLFQLKVIYNPRRSLRVFEHRVKSKDWLTTWPNLTIDPQQADAVTLDYFASKCSGASRDLSLAVLAKALLLLYLG